MFYKLLLFILGIFLISISITFIIIYFNLFTFGYTFLQYVNFIIRRSEIYLFIPGILLLYLSCIKKGKIK